MVKKITVLCLGVTFSLGIAFNAFAHDHHKTINGHGHQYYKQIEHHYKDLKHYYKELFEHEENPDKKLEYYKLMQKYRDLENDADLKEDLTD